jgi:hypothetical protein
LSTPEAEGPTVIICYVHPNQGVVREKFTLSLAEQCATLGDRVIAIQSTSSPSQVHSRNATIELALQIKPRPDYLLWWDTDMSVPAGALAQLIDIAEEYEAGISTVFGAMQKHNHREGQPWTPVPNTFHQDKDGNVHLWDILLSHTEPFWCAATGLGFTLVNLDVFENFPKSLLPWHVLSEDPTAQGHDVRFCILSGEKVLVVPTIHAKHWKTIAVEYGHYLQANSLPADPVEANEVAQVMIDRTKAKLAEDGIIYE